MHNNETLRRSLLTLLVLTAGLVLSGCGGGGTDGGELAPGAYTGPTEPATITAGDDTRVAQEMWLSYAPLLAYYNIVGNDLWRAEIYFHMGLGGPGRQGVQALRLPPPAPGVGAASLIMDGPYTDYFPGNPHLYRGDNVDPGVLVATAKVEGPDDPEASWPRITTVTLDYQNLHTYVGYRGDTWDIFLDGRVTLVHTEYDLDSDQDETSTITYDSLKITGLPDWDTEEYGPFIATGLPMAMWIDNYDSPFDGGNEENPASTPQRAPAFPWEDNGRLFAEVTLNGALDFTYDTAGLRWPLQVVTRCDVTTSDRGVRNHGLFTYTPSADPAGPARLPSGAALAFAGPASSFAHVGRLWSTVLGGYLDFTENYPSTISSLSIQFNGAGGLVLHREEVGPDGNGLNRAFPEFGGTIDTLNPVYPYPGFPFENND